MIFWKHKSLGFSILEQPTVNFTPISYNAFYRLYRENSFLFSCISTFVQSLCSIKLIHDKQDNKKINWKNIVQQLSYNLLITGNTFIDKSYNIIPTIQIVLLTNKKTNNIHAYKITSKFKEEIIDKDNLLHIKLYNPSNNYYGLSPIESAIRPIETHNAISDYFLAVVQNGGRPSGILSHAECYSDNIKKSIKEDFKELYKKMGTQSSVAILEGSYKWENIGIDPDKLKLLETKLKAEKEIAAVFGIPPILLGVSDATFSNYKEARKHFFYERVLTMLELILEQISPFYNINIQIDYQAIEKEIQ